MVYIKIIIQQGDYAGRNRMRTDAGWKITGRERAVESINGKTERKNRIVNK